MFNSLILLKGEKLKPPIRLNKKTLTMEQNFDFTITVPKKVRTHVSDKRKWLDVQRKHKRHNPRCAVCGTTYTIEVHHIIPVGVNPSLEFEESNLISLCRKGNNCHLIHGHLGNFNNHNPNILSLKKF